MIFKLKFSIVIFTAAMLVALVACKQKDESIEAKKAELEELQKQLHNIKSKIYDLKQEIKAASNDDTEEGAIVVDAMEVQPTEFRRYINIQGSVESDRVSILSSKMGGNVLDILVQEGDNVKKGQLLIKIDDATLQSRLSELNTRLTFVKELYERQKRLWEQKAGSEVQYLQAKNNYEAMLQNKKTLEEQIKDTRIYAPFTGHVDYVFPKEGEMLMPGRPAVKITDMSNVKVVANVSETYLNTVKKGVPVKVVCENMQDTLSGRIKNVAKSIDTRTRTFRAEVKLNKIPKTLRPYQICQVLINDITKRDVITVPLAYLQKSGDRYYVFVIDTTTMTAKKRYVKAGMANDTRIVVSDGLKQGEKIITKGVNEVADGQKIKIISKKLIF